MENSIEIDDIIFTLLYRSVADNLVYKIKKDTEIWKDHLDIGCSTITSNTRDIVQYKSIKDGKEKILYAYRSTSEMGVWRLGYLRGGDCGLNKFSLDYVQGSILHHELQKFINEHFDLLGLVPYAQSEMELFVDEVTIVTDPQKKYIYNNDYLLENNYDELDSTQKEEFRQRHRFIMMQFSIPADITVIDDSSRIMVMSPFDSTTIKCEDIASQEDIKMQLNTLSDQLQTLYSITSITHICDYQLIEPVENINARISMHIVELTCNENSENNVTLVCCMYDLIYGTQNKLASGIYGIALLKTNEIGINEYGIYTKFISAGAFICKPINYTRICKLMTDLEEKKCSSRYVYVGDRYADIFPYSVIPQMLLMGVDEQKESKKRSKKKSKKKSRKRFKKKSRKSKK